MKKYDDEKQGHMGTYEVISVGDKYKVALEEEFDSEESAKKYCRDMKLSYNDEMEDDAMDDRDTPEALKPTPESMRKMKQHDDYMGKNNDGVDIIVRA